MLGWLKGYEYIYEAVADDGIRSKAQAAMDGSAAALSKEYGVPESELLDHVRDLLFRFGNKALRDTTVRVGADPVRKLRRDDRLVGAALYCMEQGIDPSSIVTGIAAALRFAPEGDKAAAELQTALKTDGIDAVIEKYMGIPASGELAQMIKKEMG